MALRFGLLAVTANLLTYHGVELAHTGATYHPNWGCMAVECYMLTRWTPADLAPAYSTAKRGEDVFCKPLVSEPRPFHRPDSYRRLKPTPLIELGVGYVSTARRTR